MSVVTSPDHLLTLAEWDALPEDNSRHYELVEGVLRVSPRPLPKHQWAVAALLVQLSAKLPAHLVALPDVEVIIFDSFPATVRAPDVVVVTRTAAKANRPRFTADEVILAIEVISPGSRRTDRMTKLTEYAEAGIPDYWIVDLDDPVSVTAFQLINQDYELNAETDDVLSVTTPAPLDIDLRTLLP